MVKNSTVHKVMDVLGRVTIPADFRHELNIEPSCVVSIEFCKDSIVIRPVVDNCKTCGRPLP